MVVFGHGGNTVTRMPEMHKGLEALDLLVVADPHPTTFAPVSGPQERHLSAADLHQFECDGSRTASNRSLQWGEKIVEPIFECKNDYEVIYRLAKRLGFGDQMFKNIEIKDGAAQPPRSSCARSTAAAGSHRLYRPVAGAAEAAHGPPGQISTWPRCAAGRARRWRATTYGLPWPCWGTPEMKHPGTHILYNTNLHVKDGGGTFRARFGVERDGQTLLAEGSLVQGLRDRGRLSRVHRGGAEAARLVRRADRREKAGDRAHRRRQHGPRLLVDRPVGRHHPRRDGARLRRPSATPRRGPWPGTCPTRCRCTASRSTPPRPDLVAQYPTLPDRRGFRMPHLGQTRAEPQHQGWSRGLPASS